MTRDVVPVALCRRLVKAIGPEWASAVWLRDTIAGEKRERVCWRASLATSLFGLPGSVPGYTIGDLLAYCRSRKWGVDLCVRDDLANPIPPSARVITLDDFESEAKTMPAALALAVLAAVEKEGGKDV